MLTAEAVMSLRSIDHRCCMLVMLMVRWLVVGGWGCWMLDGRRLEIEAR